MRTLTDGQMALLDEVAKQILTWKLGLVDLTSFGEDLVLLKDAVIHYLHDATGGRVFAGDERLFGSALYGPGVHIVFVPEPQPGNPLRPEYQEGARFLALCAHRWGIYGLMGPANSARLAVSVPDGLPADYVLPEGFVYSASSTI